MPEIPAGAKKPADKKPKAEKVEEQPTTVTATVAGKEWVIPVDALDDFELLDDFNELEDKGDISRLPSILKRLLGDQWKDAMDAVRDKKTGRVSIEAGGDFVNSLMGEINPNS